MHVSRRLWSHIYSFFRIAFTWLVAGFQYFVGESTWDLRGNRSLACLHVVQRALAAHALKFVLVRGAPAFPVVRPISIWLMPVRGCPVSA